MLIVVVITAIHECKDRHQGEPIVTRKAVVVRDGRLQEIPEEQILVGDVLQISVESELPVDGLLIQVCSLLSCIDHFLNQQ